MSPPPPDYNLSQPPSLLQPGLLQGEPINIEVSSIQLPTRERPVALAGLISPLPDELRRGGEKGVVAIKSVQDGRARVPRDVRREAALLAKMDHPNILALYNAYLLPSASTPSSTFTLFTPFYPYTLSNLLAASTFLPSSPSFFPIVHALSYQLIDAIAYLHEQGIAHRDVNPANVVLSREGRVVLIDFGISIEPDDEKAGEMHHEVGTQPYRPPELIFASRSYSAPALDLWALGCTLAEFFTPFEVPKPLSATSSERSGPYSEDEEDVEPQRQTLFDGSATDFLLSGSIFKLLGTPTVETWPEVAALPSFHYFRFTPFPSLPLSSSLPHLPPPTLSPLQSILEGLLVVSASSRIAAKDVLSAERWGGVERLIPSDMAGGTHELGTLFGEFVP